MLNLMLSILKNIRWLILFIEEFHLFSIIKILFRLNLNSPIEILRKGSRNSIGSVLVPADMTPDNVVVI